MQRQPVQRLTEADLDQHEAERLPVPSLRLVVNNQPAAEAKPLPTPWDVEAERPWLTAALAVAAVGLTVLISAAADGLLAHLLP